MIKDIAVAPRTRRCTKRIFDPEILRQIEGLEPEPRVPEPADDASSRMLMVKVHELEEENRRLRSALTDATIQLNAMSKQVAVAKKLLGRRV